MKTTRSNPVIMPDSEQGEHTSREFAMNGQMRSDNAVPIFDSTTGSDSLIPGSQKIGGACSPGWVKVLQQVLAGRTKHGSSLPGPPQQRDPLRSPKARGLLLHPLQPPRQQ